MNQIKSILKNNMRGNEELYSNLKVRQLNFITTVRIKKNDHSECLKYIVPAGLNRFGVYFFSTHM